MTYLTQTPATSGLVLVAGMECELFPRRTWPVFLQRDLILLTVPEVRKESINSWFSCVILYKQGRWFMGPGFPESVLELPLRQMSLASIQKVLESTTLGCREMPS